MSCSQYNQDPATLNGRFVRGDDFTIPLQILIAGNVTNTSSYDFAAGFVTSNGTIVPTVSRISDAIGSIAIVFSDSQTVVIPAADTAVNLYVTMTNSGYTRTIVTGEYEVLPRG